MVRRSQTYAIRLAVEGGGQVKAELVSVGQSGDPDGDRAACARGCEAERAAGSGALDLATYARAAEEANDRALRSSQAWTDGATRS